MSSPTDPADLPRAELEAEVAVLRGAVADLKKLVVALRAEITRITD